RRRAHRGLRRVRRSWLSQPRLFRRLQCAPRRARHRVRAALRARDRRAGGDRLRHAGRLDGEPGVRSLVPAPLLRQPRAVEESAAHLQLRAPRLSRGAAAEAPAHYAEGRHMSLNVRRVVTDHDERGRSTVAIDERCANVISRRPGHESCVAWTGADGTIFRVVEYQPGVAPRMHRTETIDYAVVIAGEIDMQLDIGSVRLRAGDVLVQQATLHDWVNRGSEPCRIAFGL